MLNFDVRWSAFLGDVGKIDIPDIRKAVLTSRKAIPVIKVKDKIISLDKVACKAGDMLVANWINFLYYAWSYNASTYIDYSNTSRSCVDTTFDIDKGQTAGNEAYGIRVGLSNTAVATTDYSLGSSISDGTGTNQLIHTLSRPTAGVVSGTYTRDVFISRCFCNYSAAQVGVRETGIYGYTDGGTPYYGLLCRDLITVDVPVTNVLCVVYDFNITVS